MDPRPVRVEGTRRTLILLVVLFLLVLFAIRWLRDTAEPTPHVVTPEEVFVEPPADRGAR